MSQQSAIKTSYFLQAICRGGRRRIVGSSCALYGVVTKHHYPVRCCYILRLLEGGLGFSMILNAVASAGTFIRL